MFEISSLLSRFFININIFLCIDHKFETNHCEQNILRFIDINPCQLVTDLLNNELEFDLWDVNVSCV